LLGPVGALAWASFIALTASVSAEQAGTPVQAPGERAEIPGAAAVLAHIRKGFPASIKVQKEGTEDIIAVPHPYTAPCVKEGFQQLFYWDTYFINQGLLRVGLAGQARHNADDLLFLLDQLGLVPNANRHSMANRSQLPFLSQMVWDVYQNQPDNEWLKSAHATLKKEYEFWSTKRLSPCGLNRSGNEAGEEYLMGFYRYLAKERFKGLSLATREEQLVFARQALSEAETWDFTPRFDRRAEEFCAVDLNSNLYTYETNFAAFSKILANGEEQEWLAKAAKRKALIQELLWNDQLGCYTDYDWKNRHRGNLVSCAALFPLAAGIASPEQAEKVVGKMRAVLECEHGLATCEKRTHPFVYQWDHPNAWPPMQMVAIQALDRYGFKEDAARIARKYVQTVVRNFEKTGDLWEKYNAVTGTIEVADEYQMPRMMGWTAGVFVFAVEYLDPGRAGATGKP
jgi:alpha,alpha-trehalase